MGGDLGAAVVALPLDLVELLPPADRERSADVLRGRAGEAAGERAPELARRGDAAAPGGGRRDGGAAPPGAGAPLPADGARHGAGPRGDDPRGGDRGTGGAGGGLGGARPERPDSRALRRRGRERAGPDRGAAAAGRDRRPGGGAPAESAGVLRQGGDGRWSAADPVPARRVQRPPAAHAFAG